MVELPNHASYSDFAKTCVTAVLDVGSAVATYKMGCKSSRLISEKFGTGWTGSEFTDIELQLPVYPEQAFSALLSEHWHGNCHHSSRNLTIAFVLSLCLDSVLLNTLFFQALLFAAALSALFCS